MDVFFRSSFMTDLQEQTAPRLPSPLSIVQGEIPHQVECLAVPCGKDLVVVVCGGNAYHLGAVAVAHALPSLKDPSVSTSSASVITIPGHKEDEIARKAALQISRQMNCAVTLTAGLHIDRASKRDIQNLVENFSLCIQALLVSLQNQHSNNRNQTPGSPSPEEKPGGDF
jgi:gallate decarboxylase subunit D